jgi:hypothetical protein
VDWFLERGLSCVVKADSGESGIGHAIFTPDPARKEPVIQALQANPFLRDDLILVEQLIPSEKQLSPSLEFFVPPSGAGSPEVTYLSAQCFSNFGRFAGVMISRSLEQADWYPQLHRSGMRLAAALQDMGYVGHFDLDAVVDDHGRLYLLEINARRTGGTYVHEFACHTFGPDYLQRVALLSQNALPCAGIHQLEGLLERLSGLLFPDYGPGSGVVITVTSTLPNGEFGCILAAPDEAGLDRLNEILLARLQPGPAEGEKAGSSERMQRLRRELEDCPTLSRVVPSDLLILLDPLLSTLQLAYRQGRISVNELASAMELDPAEARIFAARLIEKGYLLAALPEEPDTYLARFSGRITRPGGSPLDKL